MHRDTRPAPESAPTASTPAMWASAFADSTRLKPRQEARFRRSREWNLIQRYVKPGGAILDAGCGFGEWVTFLRRNGYAAHGCDFSSELVQRLRQVYPESAWTCARVDETPFGPETFDGVISWGVIEHDEAGPGAAIREFLRLLKPGGVAIVSVPIDSVPQRRSAEILYRPPHVPQAFFQYFMTEEELAKEVADAGFVVVESGTLPVAVLQIVAPRLSRVLRGIAFRIANRLAVTVFSRFERFRVMRYCVGRKTQ